MKCTNLIIGLRSKKYMSDQPVMPSSPYPFLSASKVLITGFLVLALLGGAFLALSGPITGGLLIILVIGISSVLSKTWLLFSGIFMAIVVMGSIQLYYPQLGFIRWTTPLITGLLLIHVFLERFQIKPSVFYIPLTLRCALLFMIIALFGASINWVGGWSFVQGIKLYLQIWGLLFGLALIKWDTKTLDRLLKFLFLIALIQFPFVLHQYFVIVPEREGLWRHSIVALDVVAGTFGADYFAGGKNMVLSAYLIMMLAGVSALWREKAIKGYVLLFASPFLLAPLFLNETKFALILLLFSLFYVFRCDLIQKPSRFLMLVLIGLILTLGLLTTYADSYGEGRPLMETIIYAIDSNVEDQGYNGRELNRVTVLSFWMQQHGIDNFSETILGHGLGAAHESSESILSSVVSLASSRYDGYGIGLTSISSLLWDTGLLGTLVIIAMFISAFITTRNLGKHFIDNPWRAGIFEGMQVAVLVNALLLFHNNYFVLDAVYQTVVYFVFGYIAFWAIRVAELQSVPMQR